MHRTILTDIEGTVGSISFVKEVLFPYSRRELPRFVREKGDDPEIRHWLDAVAAENGGICQDAMIVETLQGWIDSDRKHTALKALQGLLWADGYASRAFKAHVYADAVTAMRRWQADGHPLAVYSSGSVAAQELFFRNTDDGDLLSLFDAFFDTQTGPKRDAGSYARIASELGRKPADVMFLSDLVAELDAAREAGLRTVLIDRREDYPEARTGERANGHARAEDFSGVHPDAA